MESATLSKRSRANTDPYHHYKDGHAVQHRVTPGRRAMVVRVYRRRRYATAEYIAALLDLNYGATNRTMKALRRLKVLKLCDLQEANAGLRMTGYLYCEPAAEGFAILAEEGVHIEPHKEDGQFGHTLARDLVMLSHEIGVHHDHDLELIYRDDLPARYELQKVNGKRRFMVCDEQPFTIRSKSTGAERHIAGLEIETGANAIMRKDADRTAVIQKFRHMIWLMESGELERTHHFGKQFYWEFVFRTELRMKSAMVELEEMTKHNPMLRKHFLFKRHPIFGKSPDKPRPTGHMLTEAWARVGNPPLYLDGGKNARQQAA